MKRWDAAPMLLLEPSLLKSTSLSLHKPVRYIAHLTFHFCLGNLKQSSSSTPNALTMFLWTFLCVKFGWGGNMVGHSFSACFFFPEIESCGLVCWTFIQATICTLLIVFFKTFVPTNSKSFLTLSTSVSWLLNNWFFFSLHCQKYYLTWLVYGKICSYQFIWSQQCSLEHSKVYKSFCIQCQSYVLQQ